MRVRPLPRALRILALSGVLALLLRWAWLNQTQEPVRFAGEPAQALLIDAGESAETIGRKLQALGLVRSPLIFRALVLARGDEARLRSGEYALDGTLSLEQIVSKIVRGEVARHDVTFPEGKTLAEMAEIAALHGLDAEKFQEAARDAAAIRDLDPAAPDLEGYLFPDTYDFARHADVARALVQRMVQRFRKVINPELPLIAGGNLTLRQIVTLASLVELETARADERPRIAAVFLNRLRKKMPLQTDPTVIYALRKAGRYDGNIHKPDLALDSPYNTYRYPGLPPGPICSPGRESLTAVLNPAESRELLIGKAISPEQARAVLAVVERDALVRKVRSFQSMMLGPDDVLLALRINFQDGLDTDQLEQAIDRVSASVRAAFPPVRHLVIEPES
jgi:UPF0755 protein